MLVFETNTLPSMTVPDETMSVKELVYRFAQGMPLDTVRQRVPIYDDTQLDDEWDVHPANLQDLDLVDLIELHRNASERLSNLKAKMDDVIAQQSPEIDNQAKD